MVRHSRNSWTASLRSLPYKHLKGKAEVVSTSKGGKPRIYVIVSCPGWSVSLPQEEALFSPISLQGGATCKAFLLRIHTDRSQLPPTAWATAWEIHFILVLVEEPALTCCSSQKDTKAFCINSIYTRLLPKFHSLPE